MRLELSRGHTMALGMDRTGRAAPSSTRDLVYADCAFVLFLSSPIVESDRRIGIVRTVLGIASAWVLTLLVGTLGPHAS